MSPAAQANALSSYYITKYEEKYGRKPVINRNKARWSWDNILQDFKPAEVRALIDYYFSTQSNKGHDLETFFYNYDKIAEVKNSADDYRAERQKKMDESRERARKWRERREGRTESN